MAKIKKKMKWDDCPHALCPFGKNAPLCSYGMNLRENPTLKDFKPCMNNGKCLKEETEKINRRN